MDGPSGLPAGPPWVVVWVTLAAVAVGLLLGWLPEWWLTRRDQRRWDRGEAARRRQWAEEDRRQALQQQVRELEQQIREEQMSEEERAWHQAYRGRQAEIHREACRRLGLPEEEDDGAL
jgi:hypothetical protein